MNDPLLSDEELARFSGFVEDRTGLLFPPGKYNDLKRGIVAIAADRGFPDLPSCLAWIMSSACNRSITETLASSLTVGETYFFREPRVFETIEHSILPAILSTRSGHEQSLRVWIAGCSTGEEAYSFGILLSRLIPDINNWSITLLATDINPIALKKAESGVFGEWSFRSSLPAFKARYFRKRTDGRYEIREEIRKLVTFSYLNLVGDVYPSLLTGTNAMDIILCRNVLMYFSREAANGALEKIRRSLVPGGTLIVSVTETSIITNPFLIPENYNGITVYRQSDTLPSREPDLTEVPGAGYLPPISITGPGYRSPAEESILSAAVSEDPESSLHSPSDSIGTSIMPVVPDYDPYTMAHEMFESGDYNGAEEILSTYCTVYPDNPKILALMAEVLANRGDLSGAACWCIRAIAQDKLNPLYHHLLATIRQEEGEIDVAIGELRKALYADPTCIPAYFTLATLKRQQGNLTESGLHFRNALVHLSKHHPDEIIEGAGGMSVARLECIIRSITGSEITA